MISTVLRIPPHLLTLWASGAGDLDDPKNAEQVAELARSLGVRVLVTAGEQPSLPDVRRRTRRGRKPRDGFLPRAPFGRLVVIRRVALTVRLRVLAAQPERALQVPRSSSTASCGRSPTHDELKAIQRLIRERLLLPVPLSPIVYSDIPGRSATQNAEQHLNQPNVASADIRNCYDGMTNAMVFRVFRNTLRLGDSLAGLLTRLTTRHGHLPQGAPTSGALANLILSPLDVQLEQIAATFELRVTRYVDNIDLSGLRTREAMLPTIQAVQAVGFAVRHKKVFNAGYRRAKIVTGQLVAVPMRLPLQGNIRANVHEIIGRHENGLPLGIRAMRRLHGRLQYLRTQGHSRDAERLMEQLDAAGITV